MRFIPIIKRKIVQLLLLLFFLNKLWLVVHIKFGNCLTKNSHKKVNVIKKLFDENSFHVETIIC